MLTWPWKVTATNLEMKTKLRPFFGRKPSAAATVVPLSTILAAFNQTMDQLDALKNHNQSVITRNRGEIEKLHETNLALSDEATRAGHVRAKIAELIS